MNHDLVRLELDEVETTPITVFSEHRSATAVIVAVWCSSTCMSCGGWAEDVLFSFNMN